MLLNIFFVIFLFLIFLIKGSNNINSRSGGFSGAGNNYSNSFNSGYQQQSQYQNSSSQNKFTQQQGFQPSNQISMNKYSGIPSNANIQHQSQQQSQQQQSFYNRPNPLFNNQMGGPKQPYVNFYFKILFFLKLKMITIVINIFFFL